MPKIPNPFDRQTRLKKGSAFKPLGMPKRKAGADTRPTERVTPRKPKARPMPMPKGPKGDGSKARPMPMPRGPSKRIQPRPMPYGTPRRKKP